MATATLDRTLYAEIGAALEYPGSGYLARIAAAHDAIASAYPGTETALGAFLDEIDGKAPDVLEELYAHTFDFAPLCNAYVSVHVFGDESCKRSQLMTGLAEAYRLANFDRGAELPDHLAVILRFSPYMSDAEWEDMVQCCLRCATGKMLIPLEGANNPYRHLLRALVQLFDVESPEEAVHV